MTIADLGLSPSTFYRWQRRYHAHGEPGLMDRESNPGAVWNQVRPAEQTAILETALRQPDLSPRELACHVTDHAGLTVSEATVYRMLKRHGPQPKHPPGGLFCGQGVPGEDRRTQPTVAVRCQLLLRGRLGMVLLEVLDDYSRFVLASDLKPDMPAHSISDVVGPAIAFSGMRQGAARGSHQIT